MAVLDREKASSHHKLSPSGSFRWIPCPGSIAAQEALRVEGEDDSNEHSRRGVAAHALLEVCMLLGAPPEEYIGMNFCGENHPPVDDDMVDGVKVALDHIDEQLDVYGAENLTVLPESKVSIGPQINITGNDETDTELCSGTSDIIIAHNDRSMCEIIDYKNGVGIVMAKENPQGMLYAAGARQKLGKFKKYKVTIIQPNAGRRRPIDEWVFTDAHLRTFLEKRARPAARAAILPNPPRSAGEHCKFCKAAPTCRTYQSKVRAVARIEFDTIEEPDPELLSNEEVLEFFENIPMIKNYISSVENYALALVQRNPKALPGWTLGWGKRTKEWADEIGIISYCEKLGIPVEDYAPRGLLSPAQMDKLLKRRMPKTTRRKRGSTPPPSPIAAFIGYSVPSPKLVRSDTAGDFEPVEDEELI